ncbi:MAG: tRNA lysidine(34) synthetase TilS, partial [Burkholderiales bacterium]|nr:tRNA lysidine(34) synthetase TilS [Anaerolineae bacterium]
MTVNLPQIVLQTLTKRSTRLIEADSVLVVGVSGGADSLALLHILNGLRERLDIRLHVATLDHGLRAEVSAADAEFVRQLAEAWGLPVTVGYKDVPTLMKTWRIGIEAAARRARYDFLAKVARDVSANHIAVAHHADDQAETVLMRILRGTGLRGLGGMAVSAPLPEHSDLTLLRPMLKVSRADIEAYCREHDLQPREDATNRDTTYTRNRLRHETIPLLEQVYPGVKRALTQLADIAAMDDDYLELQLQREFIEPHVRIAGELAVIGRANFQKLHPSLQRRALAWVHSQFQHSESSVELGYRHIIAAVEVALTGQTGAVAQFPDGIQMRVEYGRLVFEKTDTPPAYWDMTLTAGSEISITIQDDNFLFQADWGWTFIATLQPKDFVRARLAIAEGANAILRTRQQGDRFAPLGMGSHTR